MLTHHKLLISSLLRDKTSEHPITAEEDGVKVCTIMTAESLRHWYKKELLVAKKEDHQTLSAAERLATTPDFS